MKNAINPTCNSLTIVNILKVTQNSKNKTENDLQRIVPMYNTNLLDFISHYTHF